MTLDPIGGESRERGGFGLHAQWSDDFHHALHTILTGEMTGYYSDFGTLANLAKALKQAYVYDGCFSSHRRRPHGRPPDGLDGHHFLAYLQNHDQVGNRAKGDRTSQLISPGKLKIGAALVLTAPFIPMLFQGEEWAANTPFFYFTDYPEPELARAVREGRCREFAAFGWKPEDTTDPQAAETFDRSKLNWSELSNPVHTQLLDWHKQLIQLRHLEPSLSDGRLNCVHVTCDENERWLVLERGEITVACNFGTRYHHIPLGLDRHKLILASEANIHGGNGINFPPESVAIFKQTSLAVR